MKHFLVRVWLVVGLGLGLSGWAAAQCNFAVTVAPGGPLTLPPGGATHLLMSTISTAGTNYNGPGFNDVVSATTLQPDGKLLVGGRFTTFNGTDCPDFLARLNPDGALDTSFNPPQPRLTPGFGGFNAMVRAIVVQPDGKLLVGGNFDSYNGVSCPRSLVRLNADGSLDASFNPGGYGFRGLYNTSATFALSLALQPDGKVVVGGDFFSYNNADAPNYLCRLNADGSLDAGFNSSPPLPNSSAGYSGIVQRVLRQPDGKLLVAGHVGSYNGASAPFGLSRLNADGSLDATFNPGGRGFDGDVLALALQADGQVVAGGAFTTFNGAACATDLVRLSAAGLRDMSFAIGTGFTYPFTTNYGVMALGLQADGKLLVGGHFSGYNGQAAAPDNLLRLNPDGSLDATYNTGGSGFTSSAVAAYMVNCLSMQPDGKAVAGGILVNFNGWPCAFSLVRANTDGSLDNLPPPLTTTPLYHWRPGGETTPSITVSQAGTYSVTVTANGCVQTSNEVVITPPGACAVGVVADPAGPVALPAGGLQLKATAVKQPFNKGGAGFDVSPATLLRLPDGRVLVGGSFTNYNGQPGSRYLVRLLADGSFDSSFSLGGAGLDGPVSALAVQPDGKVLVGGLFANCNGLDCPDGLLRLAPDGAPDPGFNPGGGGYRGSVGGPAINALLVQPDGKIVVGGGFASFNGQPCSANLMRLDPNGTLDTGFGGGMGFNAGVAAVLRLATGQLLVGGQFWSYNGVGCPTGLARLSATGQLDPTFNSSTGTRGFNGNVYALLLEAGGSVLVGGNFTTYNGTNCSDGLTRIGSTGALQTFNASGTGFVASGYRPYVATLAQQADGKILAGGSLGYFNSTNSNRGVVRLNPGGSIDATFNGGSTLQIGFDSSVTALDVAGDGTVLVVGAFQRYTTAARTQRLGRIGRLLSTGVPDTLGGVRSSGVSYRWSPGGEVTQGLYVTQPGTYSVTATVDGCAAVSNQVVVSGMPAQLPGSTCGVLVRATPPGPVALPAGGTQLLTATAVRPAFNAGGAGFNGVVAVALPQPDGKVLVGGSFTRYNNADCPDFLVRLLPDGKLDPTFNSASSGFSLDYGGGVYCLLVQPDGNILVGGLFTTYNGLPCSNHLVRLLPDGAPDPSFNPGGIGLAAGALSLAQRPDGRIVVGGGFDHYNGVRCPFALIQVLPNGSLDPTFNPGGAGCSTSSAIMSCSANTVISVAKVALQPDGKVLMCGIFTSWNGQRVPTSIARLTATGAVDPTFNPGGSGDDCLVGQLILLPNGNILINSGGVYNGARVTEGPLRLLPNGSIDPTFNWTYNVNQTLFTIRSLVAQPDGKILASAVLVRVNGSSVSSIVRLTADGVYDPSFNAGGTGLGTGRTGGLALQADGKILTMPYEPTSYNGRIVPDYLCRLNADGTLNHTDETLTTGVSYAWSPGGQTGATRTVAQPGLYTATATLAGGCTATSNAVLVTGGLAPTITGLTPGSGVVGATITLTGTNLAGLGTLTLNGQPISGFVVNSAGTSVSFTVPAGATSGPVGLSTAGGAASSPTPFVVTAPQLAVAMGPTAYASGSSYGFGNGAVGSASSPTSFTLANAGTAPLPLSSVSLTGDFTLGTPLPTTVPAGGSATVSVSFAPTALGARNGLLTITSPLGSYFLRLEGVGVPPAPTVSSLSPGSGAPGTQVVITGTNFVAGATTVTFSNGVVAPVLPGSNAFTLTVAVPAGAVAGPITLSTAGGTITAAGAFCVQYAATTAGTSHCGPGSATLTGLGLSTTGHYAWYDQASGGQPLPASGPNDDTFVTPSLSQSTTYYLTIGTGTGSSVCEGPRQPVLITIDAGPTVSLSASGPLALCPGSSLTLTAGGAASYRWSTGATTASIAVSAAGTYSVVGSNAAGCAGAAVASVVGTSPAPPQPSISLTPTAGAVLLSSSSSTGNQWYLGGSPVPGATGPTLTVSSASQQGTYTVVVSSAAGCASPPSAGQAVVLATAPARPTPGVWVWVYPNPARGSTTVRLAAVPGATHATLVLRDALGRPVRTATCALPATGTTHPLSVAGLAAGIYLLQVQAGPTLSSQRLVVE